jgi:linoleoyl-CoA desaturase
MHFFFFQKYILSREFMKLRIHNHIYDLSDFSKNHPGGQDILKTAAEMEDATPMFESYHSMKFVPGILRSAKSYQLKPVDDEDKGKGAPLYTYHPTGFYNSVRNDVKQYFNFTGKSTKADWIWVLKVFISLGIIAFTVFSLFLYPNNSYEQIIKGLLVGTMHVSIGFNVMHDASHYAISQNPVVNETISRITNATLLWNHHIWARHHVYAHHSFTGEISHDPDIKNSRPFLRKTILDPVNKYFYPILRFQDYFVTPILCGFPGQFVGQSLVYISAIFKNRVWGVPIQKDMILKKRDAVSYLMMFLYHSITMYMFPLYSLSYYASANTIYFVCIAPDHDTFESAIEHHDGSRDWGELQVRRSANFATDYPIVSFLFGGINYQIEHHLFPSISHIHYPDISRIVKKACEKYDIPYTSLSWTNALISCFQNYSFTKPS